MKIKLYLFILFCFLESIVVAQTSEKRLALVIGNADYQNGGSLRNPVNDANLMEKTLQELGFEVIKKTDADLRTMQLATAEFTNKIQNYDVALFYYAGHGVQINGVNYLIPVDANLEEQVMTQFEAFDIKFIMNAFERNKKNVNIMILDACRNNPFRSWIRSTSSQGFVSVGNQQAGSIIAFATREGDVAIDAGDGNNGLFTEKLVEEMKKEMNITEVFQNTRIKVLQASDYRQCPQEWNMLTGNFMLAQKSNLTENSTTIAEYGKIILSTNITGDLFIDNQSYGSVRAFNKIELNDIPTGNRLIEVRNSEDTLLQYITVNEDEAVNVTFSAQAAAISPSNITDELEITGANGMLFRKIEGGSFVMGSLSYDEDEKPAHNVLISTFYISKFEVTQAQWKAVMEINPSHDYGVHDNCPVYYVNWYEVQEFITKLNEQTGQTYRLPTEAEWEYAAGGGVINRTIWFGTKDVSTLRNYAWYSLNSNSKTHFVGQKQPNYIGLYDMSGNVWEWCSDWYGEYPQERQNNPTGATNGTLKMIRGGGFNENSDRCRITERTAVLPEFRNGNLGFRLVLVR